MGAEVVTNIQIQRPSRKKLKVGDVFAVQLPLTERFNTTGSQEAFDKLTALKNGADDQYWKDLGQLLLDKGLTGAWPDGRSKLILRIGWEHNGGWYPWSSQQGREELFADAYRQAVTMLQSTAGDMTVVWGSSTLQNSVTKSDFSDPLVDPPLLPR